MQEIKWDIAWNLYDEVNDNITPYKPSNISIDIVEEIDLHCLDIDEAKAITKQKIFDLAEQTNENPRFTYKCSVLAILVSSEQFILEATTDSFSSKHLDDYYFEAMDEGSAQST